MDAWQAMDRLLAVVPEFRAGYESSVGHPCYDAGGELLLHVVMGDLARFYMERAAHDHALASRFWRAVEELASRGDERVRNAVDVSLIEWFALGGDADQAALAEAEPCQGEATRRMVRAYRRS